MPANAVSGDGTRLLPFLLVAFLGYLLIVHRSRAHQHLGHYTLLAAGYVVGFGPLLVYFVQVPHLYFGRGASVLTWNRIPLTVDDFQQMWATLWPLMAQNLLTVSSIGASVRNATGAKSSTGS